MCIDTFLSGYFYHVICKILKYLWIANLVRFRQITSRNILAKSQMIGLVGMSCYGRCQISQTVSYGQLAEHHYKQLVPACKMLDVFIFFVFHYNSIKYSLRQKFYKLSVYIYSCVHVLTLFLCASKDNQIKSSPRKTYSKCLIYNVLH